MKSYWSYRESKSRSESITNTVSLDHAVAGRDTSKNISVTLNDQEITGICVEADKPEGWADVLILSGGKPVRDAVGEAIFQRLHGEVGITLTKERKRVKI